jgi:hypothetical protein
MATILRCIVYEIKFTRVTEAGDRLTRVDVDSQCRLRHAAVH